MYHYLYKLHYLTIFLYFVGNYDAARKHLDKATYQSDLQTEAEDETIGVSQKRAKK